MSFLDLVNNRESTRKYTPDPIDREKIERCLEAARLAPSASNSQPWTFIVVDEPELKDKLVEEAFSGILHNFNKFTKNAPVLVVVVTERMKYITKLGSKLQGIQYSLIDIGIACEHFVLQAEEEGLGTCMLGWFNEKGVRKTLNLPKDCNINVLISLGYPESKEKRSKNRKTLDEIRSYNKYIE